MTIRTGVSQRISAVLGLALACVGATASAQATSLDGKTMAATLIHITEIGDTQTGVVSPPFVVGPSVELAGFGFRQNPSLPALVDIDISSNQALITLVIDQPQAFTETLRLSDFQDNIPHFTNVTINPATNWAGFTPSHLSRSFETISVDVSQLSGLQGQQILLDITVLPEPASAGLALAAVGAAMAARRRRYRTN